MTICFEIERILVQEERKELLRKFIYLLLFPVSAFALDISVISLNMHGYHPSMESPRYLNKKKDNIATRHGKYKRYPFCQK